MKRSTNPFDVFVAEDPLCSSKNNPFLKQFPASFLRTQKPSLENRLARLKEEMKEYERRMTVPWQPPVATRQAEIVRLQADLERRRQQLHSEGVHTQPSHNRSTVEALEGECLQRLHFMRASLERKKREINSALTRTRNLTQGSEAPTEWRVQTLCGAHRHSETQDFEFGVDSVAKESEVATLRTEQVRMKAEMEELRERLAELERRSFVPLFGATDGEHDQTYKESVGAPFPRSSHRTNSLPLS